MLPLSSMVSPGRIFLMVSGASVMSVTEVLQSPDPIEVVWTVPAEQQVPSDPQAVETLRQEPSPPESNPEAAHTPPASHLQAT